MAERKVTSIKQAVDQKIGELGWLRSRIVRGHFRRNPEKFEECCEAVALAVATDPELADCMCQPMTLAAGGDQLAAQGEPVALQQALLTGKLRIDTPFQIDLDKLERLLQIIIEYLPKILQIILPLFIPVLIFMLSFFVD